MDITLFMQQIKNAKPLFDEENNMITKGHIFVNTMATQNTKDVKNLTEIMICIEEMSELSQLLTDYISQDESDEYMDEEERMHILEEMADTYIMMVSMEILTEKKDLRWKHIEKLDKQTLMESTIYNMAEMTKTLCKAVRNHISIDREDMKTVISENACSMKQRITALLPVFGFTMEDLRKAIRVKQDNYKKPVRE